MVQIPDPPRTTEPWRFRPMADADLNAVNAIYNHAGVGSTASFDLEPRTDAQAQAWLTLHADPKWPVVVVEMAVSKDHKPADTRVIGYGSLSPWALKPGYAHTGELSLYLLEDARGQGIGTALLRHLCDLARDVGLHTVVSGITTDNASSLAMHRTQGFTEVGTFREVGRKFDRWLDVTWMQRVVGETKAP